MIDDFEDLFVLSHVKKEEKFKNKKKDVDSDFLEQFILFLIFAFIMWLF